MANIESDTLKLMFNGADTGVLEMTTAFVNSLPLSKALDEHTLTASAMNGAYLPHWNGSPARLVVPGWAATYWV
jgi:sulfite dehydrogenase (cytochrome) subunit A